MKILVTSMIDIETSAHNRLHQFLEYLSQKHEVTVVSISDQWKIKHECDSEKQPDMFLDTHSNIQVYHYTNLHLSPIIQEILSPVFIRLNLQDVDFSSFDIHYNYNGMFGGYAITKILDKFKIPSIYDIADNLPAMLQTSPQLPKFLRPIAGVVGSVIYSKNIKNSKLITVTTKGLGVISKIPEEKMVIIPNGVDTNLFHENGNRDTIRKACGLGDSFTIGYVGVLREWVDCQPLFMAVQNLKKTLDLKILIVGSGPEREKLNKLTVDLGIDDVVVFTGNVPYNQVPDYISAMDVCTIPFKTDRVAKDSLPLKLFEYMACGKQVISSRIDIIVEEMSECVLFAENMDEYKEAIETIHIKYKMIPENKKYKHIIERYTWNGISQKLERTLSLLIKR